MKERLPLIVISYNHEDYIAQALESVIEQQQEKYELEILIVDDGSNDKTQEIITSFQQKYPNLVFPTFKKHVGITAINKNFNEQIKKAKGEYIAFLAGDDKFLPNRFEKQVDILKNDAVELVIGDGINYDLDKNSPQDKCQEIIIVDMLKQNKYDDVYKYIVSNIPKLFIQSYLIRKRLLIDVDYFDEEVIADDWVLNIKFFNHLKMSSEAIVYIDDILFQHNFHSTNTTNNPSHHCPRVVQVIEKYAPKHNYKSFLSRQVSLCTYLFLIKSDLKNTFRYLLRSVPLFHYVIIEIIKKIKKS